MVWIQPFFSIGEKGWTGVPGSYMDKCCVGQEGSKEDSWVRLAGSNQPRVAYLELGDAGRTPGGSCNSERSSGLHLEVVGPSPILAFQPSRNSAMFRIHVVWKVTNVRQPFPLETVFHELFTKSSSRCHCKHETGYKAIYIQISVLTLYRRNELCHYLLLASSYWRLSLTFSAKLDLFLTPTCWENNQDHYTN